MSRPLILASASRRRRELAAAFDAPTRLFAPLDDEVVTLLEQQGADVRLRPYWTSSSECRRYTLRRGEEGDRP